MEPVSFFSSDFFVTHLIFLFIIGTIVGSFLNVCIFRIPAKKSIVFPNSYCYSCGSPIRWYDNIPLLSYLILRGRCRDCAARISPRYFLIEFLTGVLFVTCFIKMGYTWSTPIYIVFVCYFIIATFTDLDHWIIPDSISIGGFVVALVFALVVPFFYDGMIITREGPFSGFHLASFLNSLIGGATGFALLYVIGLIGSLIFQKEAMGGGDVKLFAFVGAIVGWLNTIIVLALSSILGALVGLIIIGIDRTLKSASRKSSPIQNHSNTSTDEENVNDEQKRVSQILERYDEMRNRLTLSRPLPFGPYIGIAATIVILWHKEITRFALFLSTGTF